MKLAKKLFSQYLEPGEEIIEVFHKHPFVLTQDMIKIIFFGYFLPIFLYVLFPEFVLFFVLWMCVSMVRLLYALSTWYHDAILLTNVSLVDVTWSGFFKRSSSRLEYPMIQGVSYEINGFLRTVFNFGNVEVKSNSGGAQLVLKDAFNPPGIERRIMEHQEKFVSNQTLQDSDALKNLLASLVRNQVKGTPMNGGNSSNQ